jgi:two-component system NtrC family sensor kinase
LNRAIAVRKVELEGLVTERTQELQSQKEELQLTIDELRTTQAQLIHAEKMASLGELTAGIAHEIQNPLNFVNNFAEVSTELIEELKSERHKTTTERDERLEDELLDDIKQNLEKINHHGKRADSIVKGMLQHSRKSSGQKEPTDINALADEYLRLSYHGLRAKDKSFNASFKTDFDTLLEKIDIIPEDIGRLLLNLYNNAFYAVSEKKKSPHPLKGGEEYQPTVSVSTRRMGDNVQITVADNGTGIPQKIADKIFQPFFTTKPTGQGTGLGLSLSYDIVKAHGGEIKVETKETLPGDPPEKETGTAFIILLPLHKA